MSAAVIAAIAAIAAAVVSLAGILIGRRDRSDEWRRDIVIPAVQRFLAAATEADQFIAAQKLRANFGEDVFEVTRAASEGVGPSLIVPTRRELI
jgi:hypothetical protein